MDQETLWREYEALPSEAKRQVEEFIEFLTARYAKLRAVRRKDVTPLTDEPFVGMWHDRDDMTDSSEWVRSVRQREWKRRRG